MNATPSQFQLGNATITIINVCDSRFDLTTSLNVDAATVDSRYTAHFATPARVPVQCIYIQLPETTVLVDAGLFAFEPGSPFALPNYQPPPDLFAQLADTGLDPVAVEHLIITHAHGDHFNALTIEEAGVLRPAFPNAKVHLGRADWEQESLQQERADPTSLIGRTFEMIWQHGLLHLVTGDLDLGHGLRICHTPGETPGHQALRLESAGAVLYCVGDLYHHTVEVEQPSWNVTWADSAANLLSRAQLATTALAEGATLIATHIRGVGQLQAQENTVHWVTIRE